MTEYVFEGKSNNEWIIFHGDQVFGFGGNDSFQLFNQDSKNPTGDTLMDGGSGNDSFNFTYDPTRPGLTVIGGKGADLLIANLSAFTGDITVTAGGKIAVAGVVTASSIERLNFSGGSGNDTMTGGKLNDHFGGNDGSDTLKGMGGDDSLIGGKGLDFLEGGEGLDGIIGLDDRDTIQGGAARDTIEGNEGDDLIFGDSDPNVDPIAIGDDDIDGGAGDDEIHGGGGKDTIYGDEDPAAEIGDDDTLFGDDGDDEVRGGGGDDTISGGRGNDILSGGFGLLDRLSYADTDDDIEVDLVAGKAKVLNINEEIDTISFFENVIAGVGDDLIIGNGLKNRFDAGDGKDRLFGGGEVDILNGAGGDDTIEGGTGLDQLDGGAGKDTVSYAQSAFGVLLNLATGQAEFGGVVGIETALDFEVAFGSAHGDQIKGNGATNILRGLAGNDALFAAANGDGGIDVLAGDEGDDLLVGSKGNDDLQGCIGNDNLRGGAGDDTMLGGEGNDLLDFGGGSDLMDGGAGDDKFTVKVASDAAGISVIGDSGTDLLDLSQFGADFELNLALPSNQFTGPLGMFMSVTGIENVEGGAGSNAIGGDGGRNKLHGNGGIDILAGFGGNDTLNGGAGKDLLEGGAGRDQLMGGGGRDRFVFANTHDAGLGGAADTITDFSSAQADKIDLREIDANQSTGVEESFTFIGSKAFTGTEANPAYAELRYAAGRLQGDVTGDGVADFEIVVGVGALGAGDILL